MVQAFLALGMSELDAFRAFAETYPDDCVLLVDTIDTLGSGIPNAIQVFEELKRKGHTPVGIRLDSGDLAHLSIRAARMLDEAGFPDTTIVLSNELDELSIWQILTQIGQEAARNGLDADRIIRRLALWGRHPAGDVSGGFGAERGLQTGGAEAGLKMGAGHEALGFALQDPQPRRQAGLAPLRPPRQGHR